MLYKNTWCNVYLYLKSKIHIWDQTSRCRGAQPPADQRNWRGDGEQANYWTDPQTHMGTLSKGQSLTLHLLFLSAECSYSDLCADLWPCCFSSTFSSQLFPFLPFLMFSFHFFPGVSFLPFLCFSFHIFPSALSVFLLSCLYPLIQRFLCKKRLPLNQKWHIFQKQIKVFT